MWQNFQQYIRQYLRKEQTGLFFIALIVSGLIISANLARVFQSLELIVLDHFFHWRASEPIDPRITVITIDETDIAKIGQWPIPDQVIAESIEALKSQHPQVIGLDIYRNFPVQPGHQRLQEIFESTPNLIGVEKLVPPAVAPSSTLARLDQIGFADIVPDADGNVRRGLISISLQNGQIRLGFAIRLALKYLAAKGITPQSGDIPEQIQLGQAQFVPLHSNAGAYVGVDTGGYQVLLNFRGSQASFQTVSISQVLEGKVPTELLRDRIVLIGSTAESIRDFFQTPYQRMPGIIVHANLISQIVSAALEGYPLIQTYPEPIEWLWIVLWSCIGTVTSWRLLQANLGYKFIFPYWTMISISMAAIGLATCSYVAFLGGWWIPTVSPLLALVLGAIVGTCYYSQKLKYLVAIDGLTQLANRRHFDQFLIQQGGNQKSFALILCDIDYFKKYNDTYGHLAGDDCLRKVAQALRNAVRRSDLVARYGGEEFAVILPYTNTEMALQVAERMLAQVRALQIPHMNSKVNPCVTLSCGVASSDVDSNCSPTELVLRADKALYAAKEMGRNRTMLG